MKIFIPQVQNPKYLNLRRGVVVTDPQNDDISMINVSWWYDYRARRDAIDSNTGYVPMSWGGETPAGIDKSYNGYLLVYNEPDLREQANTPPEIAAEVTKNMGDRYPFARIIAGGISQWGVLWMEKFVNNLEKLRYKPAGFHFHGYVAPYVSIDFLENWLFSHVQSICKGGEIWLTEFADVQSGSQSEELLKLVISCNWIKRYSWFAKHLTGKEPYYPSDWGTNPSLLDEGQLITNFGRLYCGIQ